MQRPSLFYLIPVNNRSFILTPLVLGHKGSKEPNANDFWTNFIAFTAEMAVICSIYCCHLLASFLIFLICLPNQTPRKALDQTSWGSVRRRLDFEQKRNTEMFLSYSLPILSLFFLFKD